MTVWSCAACAVEFPDTAEPPTRCPICDDERQYVPRSGQAWTSMVQLAGSGCMLEVEELESDLFGIKTVPSVGIGQRALLLCTADGNLLWDPPGFVDEANAQKVLEMGRVSAIVASHPHMFGAQVEWSKMLGGVPVLVAEADRSWLQRPDSVIRFWSGEEEILPGVTLRIVGGHFPGSAIVCWDAGADGRGVVLSSDTIFPTPDGEWVTFLRSYPNRIPLSAAVAERVAAAVTARPFERLYGNFGVVDSDARAVVQRSAVRYAAWASGANDHLT